MLVSVSCFYPIASRSKMLRLRVSMLMSPPPCRTGWNHPWPSAFVPSPTGSPFKVPFDRTERTGWKGRNPGQMPNRTDATSPCGHGGDGDLVGRSLGLAMARWRRRGRMEGRRIVRHRLAGGAPRPSWDVERSRRTSHGSLDQPSQPTHPTRCGASWRRIRVSMDPGTSFRSFQIERGCHGSQEEAPGRSKNGNRRASTSTCRAHVASSRRQGRSIWTYRSTPGIGGTCSPVSKSL